MSLLDLSRRSFFLFREKNALDIILTLDPNSYYCTVNGKLVPNFHQRIGEFADDDLFQLHFRFLGGKGGFGSLLRSFRVNKSTNQLMCRDLNGRRLASIEEEQKLRKWIERAAEREKEKIERRNAKYEKLKSGPPKHMFHDPDYIRQKETIIEKTEEAFEQGFMELTKTKCRKVESPVESSSDSDFDIDDLPGSLKAGCKRKGGSMVSKVKEKQQKFESDSDSDSDEDDVDPDIVNEIREYFAKKPLETTATEDISVCGSEVETTCSVEEKNHGEMVVVTMPKAKKAGTRKRKAQISDKSLELLDVTPNNSEDSTVVEEKKNVTIEEEKSLLTTPKDFEKKLEDVKVQGRRALTVLKKHLSENSGKSLFPDIDHAVGLTVVYKKPALTTKRARLRIVLPSPYRTPVNTSVCIIMPDLDQSAAAKKDPDVDKQARQWAEKIEKDHGLTDKHYAKIMTKRQLEREYHSFTQRRALATMYDLFLVDVRVGKAVRSFLGKDFYKVHKEPLDFKYSKPLVTAIDQAVKTTVMKLQRYATRVHISFGHLGQHLADLGSNFDEVINSVVTWCPGGFLNIRSIYVQPVGSKPSLPVYMDNGNASEVQLERPEKSRRCIEQISDDCSTLPDGLKLSIRRNGKIRVLKEDTGASVYYPTVHDEWEKRDTLKPTINPEKLRRKHAVKKRRSIKRMIHKKIMSGEMVSVRPEKPQEQS